jgi:N6-L-threonylcarbamoyladenine synthase
LLELGYPGGPAVEKAAARGDAEKFTLPRPLCTKGCSCDFSFSGLKTAVRTAAEKCATEQSRADLAASFQKTVTDVLVYKIKQAIEICGGKVTAVAMAGGVAANKSVRSALQNVCDSRGLPFFSPPLHLCTDNGAMIAWLGAEKFRKKQFSDLQFTPRPRWPLRQG